MYFFIKARSLKLLLLRPLLLFLANGFCVEMEAVTVPFLCWRLD